MKKQIIVTLGREAGSGGHTIAQILAEKLQIKLYDKDMIKAAVLTSGYDKDMVEQLDEKPVNYLTYRRIGSYSNSLEENVAEKQFEFIKGRAMAGESFVLVGRCGEYLLRDNPNTVRIFVLAPLQYKIHHMMEEYSFEEDVAAARIRSVDHKRKAYHNHYSDIKWGDSRGYDLCISSSKMGIAKTAEVLFDYIQVFRSI
ncbi:MAG: cytidylate kinase-like family protein [Oscillospiraceae bacterium]|jgi:cytidylate kinase|nr:cytidylate kinase-like family protein [Oscillospiraceae bacterium]